MTVIPKSNRLNISKNFNWVRAGAKYEGKYTKLLFRLGENSSPKIGVAVASKEFRGSVLRVKAKRVSFDLAKLIYNRLLPSVNLVIIPKQGVLRASKDELLQDINDTKNLFVDN